MAAYIVGMITGTVALVFPLIYLMNIDRCVAEILTEQSGAEGVTQFLSYSQHTLAYVIAIVGAAVLVLSTVMAALTGVMRLRERHRLLGPSPAPAEEPPEVPSL